MHPQSQILLQVTGEKKKIEKHYFDSDRDKIFQITTKISQELGSMILMGPFHLGIFCDSLCSALISGADFVKQVSVKQTSQGNPEIP